MKPNRIAFFCLVIASLLALWAFAASADPEKVLAPSDSTDLAAQPQMRTIAGSPLTIHVGSNASVQVHHEGYSHGQVYGDADSGIFLWLGNGVYGSNLFTTNDWSAARETLPLQTQTHMGPIGDGTESNPWVITTMMSIPTQGLLITQRVSYVNGDPYFKLTWDLNNQSPNQIAFDFFHAADLYFADDDYGFGYYDPASGAVGGFNRTQDWYMTFHPETPYSHYQESHYRSIWEAIGWCLDGNCVKGSGFDDNTRTTWLDNGIGLQWDQVLEPGGRTQIADYWTFGHVPITPNPVNTRTPSPTPRPSATPTPTLDPPPIIICEHSSDRALVYRVDRDEFVAYDDATASTSHLNLITSPPAPEGWNLPGFEMGENWQAASPLWSYEWSEPGWGPLIPGSQIIGLSDGTLDSATASGATELIRERFVLAPPKPGMIILSAMLEMWSDNKTAWWWDGSLLTYDKEAYVDTIEMVPARINPHGGSYTLAIQNSNDRIAAYNPQGTAYRLCVTWYDPGEEVFVVSLPLALVARR